MVDTCKRKEAKRYPGGQDRSVPEGRLWKRRRDTKKTTSCNQPDELEGDARLELDVGHVLRRFQVAADHARRPRTARAQFFERGDLDATPQRVAVGDAGHATLEQYNKDEVQPAEVWIWIRT